MYSFESKNGSKIHCATFSGKYVGGNLRTNTEDISQIKTLTLQEIRDLNNKGKLRSDDTNIDPIEKLILGKTHPLEIFQTF